MAEIKWIKLATDVFNNRKIKQIKHMPDGNSIILVWIELLCLAGEINDNGFIYLTKEIPYTEQMMASQFEEPLATIQLALRTFEQFEMIEVVDDVLHVSNWEIYQNIEGMEKVREQTRKRVAKYRENQKKLPCNVTVTLCNAIEEDKEKEKDRDRDKKNEYSTFVADTYKAVCAEKFNPIRSLSETRKSHCLALVEKFGKEAVKEGFERACKSSFLTGSAGWKASFDWLILPSNFLKVIEGNYDDRSPVKQMPKSSVCTAGAFEGQKNAEGGFDL